MQAESVLLEPWYDMHLEVPQDCVGRAMNDVQQMGGSFEPPESHGDMATLKCTVPVEKALRLLLPLRLPMAAGIMGILALGAIRKRGKKP